MDLPRSTYYYRSKSKPEGEQELLERIEAVIEEFPGYGYRRVTRELHRQGFRDNHKKILRVMKKHGLTKKPRRRWVCTTNSRHAHRVYPNLMPNLLVTGPNQLWVADLTYIGILSGFVYLAIVLDLFARRLVGYALSQRIDTALCWRPSGRPLPSASPRQESFITRIGGSSMHRAITWRSSINMAFASVWPARGIPTTTRRLRVSSKP
jgi:hypothetical protein